MALPLKKRKIFKVSTYNKNKIFNNNIEKLKNSLMSCQIDKHRINKLKTYDYNIISYLILFYLNLCKKQPNKYLHKYIFNDLDELIESQYGVEIKENIHHYSTKIIYDLINNYMD